MTWRDFLKTASSVALLGVYMTAAPACAPSGRLYVRVGPPPPIVEVREVGPGSGYVWIDGYQRWDGGAFVWVRGRWDRPPRPRAVWVPARWAQDRHGWFLTEGRWR